MTSAPSLAMSLACLLYCLSPQTAANQSASVTAENGTRLLDRIFSVIQTEKEPVFMPSSFNCSAPLISENIFRNIEWNYFSYRINKDGTSRFDKLRRTFTHITSYAEFRRILFPAPSDFKHPFFNCAFDSFFNHLMNRTPYIWLHWIDFDGSRFPFVGWQKVNATGTGVFPARMADSEHPVIKVDAIPLPDRVSWSWEEGGPKADMNPSSDSSGSNNEANNNTTTGDQSVTADASFREGPGLMGSLKPLMSRARSLYNIYEHWKGLPRLQVKVSLE